MTDDEGETPMWSPAMFAQQFQQAGEEAMEQQAEMFRQLMTSGTGGFDGLSQLGSMGMGAAVFKTRVQSGGRISIPDAEREALDIEEGDIVQTVVVPVKRNHE